jgi:hypothetical protein
MEFLYLLKHKQLSQWLIEFSALKDNLRSRAPTLFQKVRLGTCYLVGEIIMSIDTFRRAIGVFASRAEAEHALDTLSDSGFPMDRVSVIARDADRQDNIAGVNVQDDLDNKADEGAATGAVTGGVLGGGTGLLVGLGTLAIPGIGPVMLAGAAATALATTLAGGAIGAAAGSLVGALVGLGIPEDRAKVYGDRMASGGYLVMVDGNNAEISTAETILNSKGIQELGVYDTPRTPV